MGEPVNDDNHVFDSEVLTEVVERIGPVLDSGDTVVEPVSNLLNELLTLSSFGLLGCEVVDVRSVGAELLEQFCLSNTAASVDDEEIVSFCLERCRERAEIVGSVVEVII